MNLKNTKKKCCKQVHFIPSGYPSGYNNVKKYFNKLNQQTEEF